MISFEQQSKLVNSIKNKTLTVTREAQSFCTPRVMGNTTSENSDHYDTHEDYSYHVNEYNRRRMNIKVVKQFRYDEQWFMYKYSVDNPEYSFGILKVDNLPFKSFYSKRNKKSFIGRLDRLVMQGYISPIMLFIDYKFIKWNDIDIVYDCDESWIILRGEKYNYFNIRFKDIYIVSLPFTCDYIDTEPDEVFDLNYNALVEYLQSSSTVINNSALKIKVPTMDTVYKYNGTLFNVGGWMYMQIKRNYLGLLSYDRVNKLKRITVYKYIKDNLGNIVSTYSTRFNALDKDSVTNAALFNQMCYMNYDTFFIYPCIRFNEDGLCDSEGSSIICIRSKTLGFKHVKTNEDFYVLDNSDANALLLRENYLIFEEGCFSPKYSIITSMNNATMFTNEDKKNLDIFVLYNTGSNAVYRHSDDFLQSYISEKALEYLDKITNPDFTPPEKVTLDAVTPDGEIYKNITAYFLGEEVAFVPTLTDYIIYLDESNDYYDIVLNNTMDPLDFSFSMDKSYEENVNDAIEAIINYNPLLLVDLHHTYIESRTFTGDKCNEALSYDFSYENRRGLKIPRKRWRDHETYCMVFVNGVLHENYSDMIAYANFFFMPVDREFNSTDHVEILYFKNINNNEIRFSMTQWIISQFIASTEDPNFFKCSVFEPYIHPEELNIFSHYPKNMLYYPTLITEPKDDIAFNISYRDSEGNLCIKLNSITDYDNLQYHIELEDLVAVVPRVGQVPSQFYQEPMSGDPDYYQRILNENIILTDIGVNNNYDFNSKINYDDHKINDSVYVAASKHKFVYERLYVDQKSYRIKLDRRFRYCDNQKQYMLFINGRRMNDDTYLVTVPKHTRPFTGIYLYTARFVYPSDRIELFYLPDDMADLNFNNDPKVKLKESGYIEYDRSKLDYPFNNKLFMFFVNGKKIPASDIYNVDSTTLRLKIDTNATNDLVITAIGKDALEPLTNYLHDPFRYSNRDYLIYRLKSDSNLGYDEIDRLIGYNIKMSSNESNLVWGNVAKIAILNEVVRDFWVTSGYPYNEEPFVYDYDMDEYFIKDENGNYIIPALDANQVINIGKNYVSFLYFYTEPEDLCFELGAPAKDFKFLWDYTQRLNQEEINIISQKINGVSIDTEAREYTWTEEIYEPTKFTLRTNTGYSDIRASINLTFSNPTYWGVIDEDELQFYKRKSSIIYLNDLMAMIKKDGTIPTGEELEELSGNSYYYNKIMDEYDIIDLVDPESIERIETDDDVNIWDDPHIINIMDQELMGICDDGTIIKPLIPVHPGHDADGNPTAYQLYSGEGDLPYIIDRLEKHIIPTPSVKIEDYVIGNNNYFVYAAPKKLIVDEYSGTTKVEFYFPDPYNEDIVAHCRDDKTTPIYTDGNFDPFDNTLIKLYKIDMIYMGECEYTSEYGITETYMVWRTNGFFTRLFEDYGIDIRVKSTKKEYNSANTINAIEYYDTSKDPYAE